MASRSGGAPIRTRKVRAGPDQTFTLQKGVSAAPLKGPGMGVRSPLGKKTGKPLGKQTAAKASTFLDRRKQMGQLKKPKSPFTAKELAIAAAAYSLGATGGGKKGPSAHPTKRKSKGKTLSDIEKQERKKKDRAARYERISKNPARTGPRSNKKT